MYKGRKELRNRTHMCDLDVITIHWFSSKTWSFEVLWVIYPLPKCNLTGSSPKSLDCEDGVIGLSRR